MLVKISDQNLKDTIIEFQRSRNIEEFRNTAGIWIMENARIRYKLDDDEISDLFLTFHRKAESCIHFYLEKGYTDIPSFLSVYTKHLVLNIFRQRKAIFTEEYMQLWQEDRFASDTIKNELVHKNSIQMVQSCLEQISSMGRLIISLRYNLPMKEKEIRILYNCLKKRNKPTINFHLEYENKVLEKKDKRELLLLRLNNCNRKIYNSSEVYPLSAKRRKKKIMNRLLNTHVIYSLNELSELLLISRHQAGRIYRNSLEIIKENIRKEKEMVQLAV